MTLDEALSACSARPGLRVRHDKLGEGWTMRADPQGQHWFINPHTGDQRPFAFNAADKAAHWYEVK